MFNKKKIFLIIIITLLIIGISVVNAQKVSNGTLTKKSSINIQKTTLKEISSTKVFTQKKNKVSTNNITNKQVRKNVTQKSVKTEQKTHIINNNNFKNYFDSAGNINSSVSKGDILDFQGVINQSQSMKISVPVNITSSTNDAKICLNTTATSYFGNESGNSFTINKDAAYTNISKIIFYNTQFFIINTSYVTINNITTNVTDPYVGLGVGQCAIREFCEHILVENSTFCTTNASWVATLVFTGVKDSIIRNNTIRGSGDVFNLLYLNTYNFPGVEVTDMTVNVNNTIENNYIDGTRAIASAKCYAIGIFGSNNTIRNNTINYSGVGITTGWVGSGESLSAGTKIINNSFIGGCNIVTPNNGEIINNTADTLSITTKNSIIENNTFNNIYVQTSDFILENYNISGNVLLSENIKNITIKNSSFNSIDLRGNSGNNLEDIKLIQNNISTITIGKDRTGYVNNIEINENNITNAIFINGRRNSNILIINNEIVTDADYSINISYAVDNLIIEDNYLSSSKGKGVNAIGATNTIYSQCNIGKNLPDEERIVILHNTTIKITTTEFDLDMEAVITATVTSDIGMVNDGTVTFKDSMGNILKTVYVYKGEAKLKINFTKAGTEVIKAIYDENEEYLSSETSSIITINKIATKITTNSLTTKVNDTVSITATVTNSLNTTTEGNVEFKDSNAKVLATVKLVNGVATYKTSFKTAGVQKLTAVYVETTNYKSSSATTTITVNKLNTKVSVDSVNVKVNDYVTVSVKVSDVNNKVVSEGEVSLKLNGVLLKDSKGNVVKFAVKNGVASGKLLVDSSWMKSGVKLTASYLGSANYLSSSGVTSSVKVVKHTAVLTTTVTSSAVGGDTITIKSKVAEGKTLLNKGKVTFKFNGKVIGTVTVKNGVATLKYKIPKGMAAKKYNVVTSFSHSDFNIVSKTNGVIVKKSAVKVKASKVTAKSKAVLKAKIVDKFGKNVVGTSKVTIKVDSKKVKTVTAKKGVIKSTINTSKLKKGKHKVTYNVAANKSYNAGKTTVVLTKK